MLNHINYYIGDLGVKLFILTAFELLNNNLFWKPLAVGAVVRHGVIGIGNGDNTPH